MYDDPPIQRNALVWLVYPGEEVFCSDPYRKAVKDWLNTALRRCGDDLDLTFHVLKRSGGVSEDQIIDLASDIPTSSIRVSFVDSCDCVLARREIDRSICQHEDDKKHSRECAGKVILLLLDEKVRAFPCFGAWKYEEQSQYIDTQHVMMTAYRERRFRNLCVECGYGIKKNYDSWFPCTRFGCTPKTEIWKGHRYEHLQFGDRNFYCGRFVPCFELSLESARVMLDSFLYPDFWRTVLVDPDPRYRLENFWPESMSDCESHLPLFGEYTFGLDTAAALDSYPAVSSYLHEPGNLPECRDMFLPVSIIPHLRVLFKKHSELLLLSVILSDRRYSEFNYRSIYLDGKKAPDSLCDPVWNRVWRLPSGSDMPEWKDVVLNLSSSIRHARDGGTEIAEYIALFDSLPPLGHTLGKLVVDLSFILLDEALVLLVDSRAKGIRDDLDRGLKVTRQFLNPTSNDDARTGLNVWKSGREIPSVSENLFFAARQDVWRSCFDDEMTEEEKNSIGCRLVNYVIWLRAVLGDSVHAVEAFNSNTIGRKQPSQFVAFSTKALDADARSQFKLTLTSFMQPIENAYAIDDEVQKKVGDVRRIAFQNTGHTMRNRSESVGLYFREDFEPEWFRKYRDDITSHGYALESLNDEQRAYRRSWIASRTFPRTCMILELWRFDSPSSFWWGWESNPHKKKRFFNYDNEPIEIHEHLREWASIGTLTKKIRLGPELFFCDVYLKLNMHPSIRVRLHAEIFDPEQESYCHLDVNILAALFFEVFRNAAGYGLANAMSEDDLKNRRAITETAITSTTIEGKEWLIVWNKVGEDSAEKFSPWDTGGFIKPSHDSGKGIGMIAAVIRNLELGDVMIKRYNSKGSYIYAVAVHLKGLKITHEEI